MFKQNRVLAMLAAAPALVGVIAVAGIAYGGFSWPVIVAISALCLSVLGLSALLMASFRQLAAADASIDMMKAHMATLARLVRETGEKREYEFDGAGVQQKDASATDSRPMRQDLSAQADLEALGRIVAELADAVSDHENRLTDLSGSRDMQLEAVPAAPRKSTQIANAVLGLRLAGEETVPAGVPAAAAPQPAPAEAAQSPREEAQSPPRLASVDPVLANRIRTGLQSSRHDLFLRPVVSLPQRKTRLYEATIGIEHEGVSLTGAALGHLARQVGMARQRDVVAIQRLVRLVRYFIGKDRKIPVMVELCETETLSDPVFAKLIEVMRGDAAVAPLVVIGLPQKLIGELRPVQLEVLKFFREAGGRLIATAMSDLAMRPETLHNAGFRLAQLPFKALSEAIARGVAVSDVHAQDLPGLFRRRGIETILSGIANEQNLLDLSEAELSFAEGELFGSWRLVQDDLLEVPPASAMQDNGPPPQPAVQPAAPEAAPEPQRPSFRSLLRRA